MDGVATPALLRGVVADFFAAVVSGETIDSEIVEYVAAMVAEIDSGPEARNELIDTIAALCGQFENFSRSKQDARVAFLLEQVQAVRAAAVQTEGLKAQGALANALGRLNSLSISRNGGSDSTRSSNSIAVHCSSDSEAPAAAASSQEQETLRTLRALCPRPPAEGFLLDMLRRRCGGSVQSAAEWLLACIEGGELDVEERSWVTAELRLRKELEAAVAASGEARRQIVERYHLQAVAEPGSAAAEKGRGLAAWVAGKSGGGGKQSATRYREGAIVTTKGEKFVIEKLPEWDGGSRGRVKSKRKGGVGFY